MIDINEFASLLRRNAETIRVMIGGITESHAAWRPPSGGWSILDVIHHLHDEEREDFRRRIDLLLHHPGTSWPPIDPEGWIVARKEQRRPFAESLDEFLTERNSSIEWLSGLDGADWSVEYLHPIMGPLSAGSLLVSWVAHDYLHIRQLARLLHGQLEALASPYSPAYAGSW